MLRNVNRLQFFLVPLLVAVGLVACLGYQDAVDGEQLTGVVVFLIIAVPVGILGYRLSLRQRER